LVTPTATSGGQARVQVQGRNGIDDVSGSDGLAVTNRPVGDHRQGLFVTHDEPETGPDVDDDRDATNFSYVSWDEIAHAMSLKVHTRLGNDPRFRSTSAGSPTPRGASVAAA
jgi:3-phytase